MEVQPGEQDRFIGAQHRQEAPEGVAGQNKLGENGGKNGPGFRCQSQYYSGENTTIIPVGKISISSLPTM